MNDTAIINRTYGINQTMGFLIVPGQNFWIVTLELPWKGNQKNKSCIPSGQYPIEKIYRSSNGKPAYLIKDVPGRSEILIHPATYFSDLLGCIAPGLGMKDFNDDGIPDLTYSSKAFNLLWGLDLKRLIITPESELL